MFDLEKILKDTLKDKRINSIKDEDARELSEILPGEYLNKSKTVYRAEFIYRLPLSYGTRELSRFDIPEVILSWAGMDNPVQINNLLFYDTETTGLSGGVGTWAFLTGIGRFESDQFIVRQYFMLDPGSEDEYLSELAKEFTEDIIPVSFNGRSYDSNLLNSRCIMNEMKPFLINQKDIDLLYLARRLWRKELGRCNLGYLEEQLLGIARDPADDLPSEDIPELYFEYLETGNAELMHKVFKHNVSDILSMPVLFALIVEVINSEDPQSIDHSALARLYRDLGYEKEAEACFKKGLTGNNTVICRAQLSFLYKRQNRLPEAIALWQAAAESEIYALIELAKHAEHKVKDFQSALNWTQQAMKLAYENEFVDGRQIFELQKRLNRIKQKIERSIDN
ncbi:MAG: ribonuclease H-like domain-containing protein [Candidatus Stygibacter australis]|nr:ribonuclease H-like domain-containing protein [Candidatus Stygibacter australis]